MFLFYRVEFIRHSCFCVSSGRAAGLIEHNALKLTECLWMIPGTEA